jgi:murein DD-endopeptidase MepM/ murein hydrolase activator NlpD
VSLDVNATSPLQIAAGKTGAPGSVTGPAGATPADRAKALELAQEFEAFFIMQMVRQMRQSMLDEPSQDGLGDATLTDTMDGELARQLARNGGIGLTGALGPTLDRQVFGAAATAGVAVPAALAAPAAPPAPFVSPATPHETGADPALPLPISATLSSPFGYRADPFDHSTRFHAGVDIQAAYGREVPAAGAGTVVFSGAQGGYGNTVVVEHPGGVRTRYAHLSSIQVEAGARVDAGTVLGRVGSSGRSTGPHLHFEVLQDGRPVNPEVAATKYAGQLKFGGVVADLPISQPSTLGVAAGVDDEDSGQ